MRIVVLGAGVIGITTAYYLNEAGHKVTVIDRQAGAGRETSFANAGEVSPGYASPWAGPGIPLKAIKWLLMQHGPLVVRPKLDPWMWVWLLKMLRNCTSARYALNKSRMVPLAEYSRDCLRELRHATGIEYDERSQGTLQLFRTQKQVDGTGERHRGAEALQRAVRAARPGRLRCRRAGARRGAREDRRRPAAARRRDRRLPQIHARLAAACAERGVRFFYDASSGRLRRKAGRVDFVESMPGPIAADAWVMALGSYSPIWLRKIRVHIPVYPVKGYSITVPIADAEGAPVSTVMDETYKVAITRLGDRIRVGGTAEISGYDMTLHESRRDTLEHSVGDLFPLGGDLARATFWCGLRPMTPDGPPVVGQTQLPNLYLNTGHGTLGWTMACGSAKVLADIVSGKEPEIDVSMLGPERYK